MSWNSWEKERCVDVGRRRRQDVGRAVIDVRGIEGRKIAVGRDRGQRGRRPDLPVDLPGNSPVLDVGNARAVHRGQVALVLRVLDRLVRPQGQQGHDIGREHRPGIGHRHGTADQGGEVLHDLRGRDRQETVTAIDHVERHAAVLVLLAVVRDDADLEILGRGVERLALQHPAVAPVVVRAGVDILHEAIALVVGACQTEGEHVVYHRVGDQAREAVAVHVAERGGGFDLAGEAGLAGDDRDRAGGCVLAEQGALRPAQHLDALHIDKVVERGCGAVAVDAVDEDADRALESDLVVLLPVVTMPRMRASPPVVSPEPVETRRLGETICRSCTSWISAALSISPEKALTAIGTVWMSWLRFWAVTTTSSIWARPVMAAKPRTTMPSTSRRASLLPYMRSP